MDIKWEKMPSPLDFQAWREYDRTEYHNYDREVHCKRTRTKVPVTVTKVLVSYGENNEFGIHVFEPQHEDAGARPAVLMYHGGGWSHGDPNIDAGSLSSLNSSLVQHANQEAWWRVSDCAARIVEILR